MEVSSTRSGGNGGGVEMWGDVGWVNGGSGAGIVDVENVVVITVVEVVARVVLSTW